MGIVVKISEATRQDQHFGAKHDENAREWVVLTLSRAARVHVCLNSKARYRWMWLSAGGSVSAAMCA